MLEANTVPSVFSPLASFSDCGVARERMCGVRKVELEPTRSPSDPLDAKPGGKAAAGWICG